MARAAPGPKRWLLGLVLVASLTAAVHLYYRSAAPRPVGAGPAGPPVDPAHFESPWSKDTIVLVGLGDSITQGHGASPGYSYFELLLNNDDLVYQDLIGCDLRTVLPNVRAVNLAVRASTSAQLAREQLPRLERVDKELCGLIVITSGSADVLPPPGKPAAGAGSIYGCSPHEAEKQAARLRERLARVLEGLAERLPGGCQVLLANLPDPTDGVGDFENARGDLRPWPDGLLVLRTLNGAIGEVCAASPHAHLIDVHELFLGHGIHCTDPRNPFYDTQDPHFWYQHSLEAPNDRGHDAVRRAVLNLLVNVFPRARTTPPKPPEPHRPGVGTRGRPSTASPSRPGR